MNKNIIVATSFVVAILIAFFVGRSFNDAADGNAGSSGSGDREILYWIADSYRGLEQYHQAALLYLQSAMLPAPTSMDPWAQTARFNAAESLQLAGLVDDARRIYQELLKVTQDAARRSVLSHKIQQLWLKQTAQ